MWAFKWLLSSKYVENALENKDFTGNFSFPTGAERN